MNSSFRYPDFLPKTTVRNAWKALAILIIGLVITYFATSYSKNNFDNEIKQEFEQDCNQIVNKISTRLHSHAQLLRSASSFFESSDTITRKEWKKYIELSDIKKNLPGIQGVGYSSIILKSQLQQHIQEIRNEGFPDYNIKPTGEREFYTSVIYIEPFMDQNLQELGSDMFSEPICRKAMELSCDSDIVTLSGKLKAVREVGLNLHAEVLMYVPVYQNTLTLNNFEHRCKKIKGWVYIPYRMKDLMEGILGFWDLKSSERIQLKIYDNASLSDQSLLFDSQSANTLMQNDINLLSKTIPLEFNGKKWTLLFIQPFKQFFYFKSIGIVVLISGVLISLLLFSLSLSLFNTRYRAQKIAAKLTSELKESESRFKNMFSNHNTIMLLLEPETGLIIDANLAASNFYGYPITTLCSMSIDQINTLSPELTAQERLKAASEKRNYFVFSHQLANGHKRIVEVHSSPIVYERKKILFSIIHDITERQLVEDALKESEERYKRIASQLTDYLYTVKVKNGKAVETIHNEACQVITGYSSKEFLEDPHLWIKMVVPEEREIVATRFSKILEGKDLPPFEHRIIRKDGEIRWISDAAIPKYDSDGKLISYEGVIKDITERRKAEEDLRNEQLLLRTLIDNIPDSIYYKDLECRKTLVNKTEVLFVGAKSESEVLGKSDFDIYPKELAEMFYADDMSVIQTGKPVINREEYILDENGQKRWLLSSKLPLHDKNSKIIGLVGIGRDITIRKQSETEIKLKNEQLILANANKDLFMSILAHDLRNPFNTLIGFSGLLVKNIQVYDLAKIKNQANLIHIIAKQAYDLLEDLLLWSRAQSGQLPFEPQKLNFTNICQDIVEKLKPIADTKNIIINHFAEADYNIFADVNMLKTIIRNLVSNSIKFTKNGGKINIYAEKDETAIKIKVSDNGIGMSQETISKLFDISQTQTSSGTSGEKGTGLGLLLCKEFVEKHGGKISVESELDKGTVFSFTIKQFENIETQIL